MNFNISKFNRLDLSIIIFIISFYLPSLFLNSDITNYDGSLTTTSDRIGYFSQTFFGFLSAFVISYKRENFSISFFLPKDRLSKIFVISFLVYYLYGFLLSFQSFSPLTSINLSFRGITYVLIGMGFGDYLTSKKLNINFIFTRVLFLFILIPFYPFIETVSRRGIESALYSGVGGSFNSLILLGAAYLVSNYNFSITDIAKKNLWKFRLSRFILSILILLIAILLNSLTSLLAFLVSYSILLFFKFGKSKQFRKVLFLLIFSVTTTLIIINFDFNNFEGEIFRKDTETLLSGTGRFQSWEICISNSFTSFRNIFGDGFGMDNSLRGINPFLHTCHNSQLTSLGGLGIIGGLLGLFIPIILFYIPFANSLISGNKQVSLLKEFFGIFLFSTAIFGISSPYMPGLPSNLLVLAIMGSYFFSKRKYTSNQDKTFIQKD